MREKAALELRLREELGALRRAPPVGELRFVRDEPAIVLAESSQTTRLWLENAEMFEDHPR